MSADFYVYAADVWCESCGEAIRERLNQAGQAPTNPYNEGSYDSDEYPKGPNYEEDASDSPQHCGAGADCLEAEELEWLGRDVGKVGKFFENELTPDGVDHLVEMVTRPDQSDRQKALHKLWLDYYRPEYALLTRKIAAAMKMSGRPHGATVGGPGRYAAPPAAPTAPTAPPQVTGPHAYCAASGYCVPHYVGTASRPCR